VALTGSSFPISIQAIHSSVFPRKTCQVSRTGPPGERASLTSDPGQVAAEALSHPWCSTYPLDGEFIMRFIPVLVGVAIPLLAAGCATDGGPTAPMATSPGQSDPIPVGAASPWLTTVACGATVTTDLRLESDLVCPGSALTVTGSGIKINLNGHTIAGPGATSGTQGITVMAGEDVSIYGGTMTGFMFAVFVNVSTGVVVKDIEFTGNGTSVLLQGSSGNTIKGTLTWQNTFRAFMVRPTISGILSTNNEIVDNVLLDNPTGLFLIRQPGNTIKGNTISGSSIAAINLDPAPAGASDTEIKGNLITTSGVGIKIGAGWTGNTIRGNTIQTSVCAIQGSTAGNTLKGNILAGNTADFCL
jgi:parallel beta-helix repeat protein